MSGDETGLGPRRFDLGSLDPGAFEELCYQLCRLEVPGVQRLAPPDHGLDFLLRDGDTVLRGWQAKRFTQQISWPACRDSLDRAREHHRPAIVTFCFARDLTGPQEKLFDKHLRRRHGDVAVDYWGRSDLMARLNSGEAASIARHFFGSPASDARQIARAIEAGGALDTSSDALDRSALIGDFFEGHDPYFAYQTSQRPRSSPDPPVAETTAVSFERFTESQVQRIDALPKSADAIDRYGPAGTLSFERSGRGRAARQRFEAFLLEGGELELKADEGVGFTFNRLPPALAELVEIDAPLENASVRVRSGVHNWSPSLFADSDLGDAKLDLTLVPTASNSEGWDVKLEGKYGGLTMALMLRARGAGADVRVDWNYTRDQSPALAQRDALRFLRALHGNGEMRFVDSQGRPAPPPLQLRARTLDPDLEAMAELFEHIVTIEERARIEVSIPDVIRSEDVQAAAYASYWIREGQMPVSWSEFVLTMSAEGLSQLGAGSEATILEKAYLNLFDTELFLGEREMSFHDIRITKTEPVDDTPEALLKVTVVPATQEASHISMKLRPTAP